MFSIFQKNKGKDAGSGADDPESQLPPRRMNLEERKAFRGEMVEQVIRESMLALEIDASAYRLRIMPLDERHHSFIAMVDVTHSFNPRWSEGQWRFVDIESVIRKNAFERFRLMIRGIYWRVAGENGLWQGGRESAPLYQLVSDEEKQALIDAIRQGEETPPLYVGERAYQTDIAPLDDDKRG